MDLGAMAMQGYSAFPKSPSLLEPHHLEASHGLMSYPGYLLGESYLSAKRQFVYSAAPANLAIWMLFIEIN